MLLFINCRLCVSRSTIVALRARHFGDVTMEGGEVALLHRRRIGEREQGILQADQFAIDGDGDGIDAVARVLFDAAALGIGIAQEDKAGEGKQRPDDGEGQQEQMRPRRKQSSGGRVAGQAFPR